VKRPFDKEPATYAEQIELLRRRGMAVRDLAEAEFHLRHVNFHRLSEYWRAFEADPVTHRFHPGTDFAEVLKLYALDRELRLLVLDAVERVEVSVRSQWTYQMAHRHGPHAHLDSTLAGRRGRWEQNLAKLVDETSRSHEVFIRNYRNNYIEALPPVWVVCEAMSLGQLSRWYANLKPMRTRRAIADGYGTDEQVLQSWLHHLAHLRNICAHHSRLWNRAFTITPRLPRHKPAGLINQCRRNSRKPYNTLVILLYLMDCIVPGHHWRARLKAWLSRMGADTAAMDFPGGWEQQPIWRETSQ